MLRGTMLPVLAILLGLTTAGTAAPITFSGPLAPANWTVEDQGLGGGFVLLDNAPGSITLVGGDDGIMFENQFESTLLFTTTIDFTDVLTFGWSYVTLDSSLSPSFDTAGYFLNGERIELIDTAGEVIQSGIASVQVTNSDLFGFYVTSLDSVGGSAFLTLSTPEEGGGGGGDAPEPGTAILMAAGCVLLFARRFWQRVSDRS